MSGSRRRANERRSSGSSCDGDGRDEQGRSPPGAPSTSSQPSPSVGDGAPAGSYWKEAQAKAPPRGLGVVRKGFELRYPVGYKSHFLYPTRYLVSLAFPKTLGRVGPGEGSAPHCPTRLRPGPPSSPSLTGREGWLEGQPAASASSSSWRRTRTPRRSKGSSRELPARRQRAFPSSQARTAALPAGVKACGGSTSPPGSPSPRNSIRAPVSRACFSSAGPRLAWESQKGP